MSQTISTTSFGRIAWPGASEDLPVSEEVSNAGNGSNLGICLARAPTAASI